MQNINRTGIHKMHYLKGKFNALSRYILISMTLLFVATSIQADSSVIKVSTDPWEPWVLGNEGEIATDGLAIKFTSELFHRMGVDLEINIYPYKRCIYQMKNGKRDLLLMVKKTEERKKYMLFSDLAVTDPQLIYFSKDHIGDFEWNSWKDLQEYTVGVVAGFNYGDFESAAKKYRIKHEVVSSDSQNIRKLLAGRVDFILLSRSTANYYMTQNPESAKKLKAASTPIDVAKFYFGLSKKGKAVKYLPKINEVLGEMKRDGSLDKILGLNK